MDSRLFEYEENPTASEKLPTLKQFLAKKGKGKLREMYWVRVIWKPGKWDNFTLETEAFRVRLQPTSGLYGLLKENLDAMIDSDQAIGIKIMDTDGRIGMRPDPSKGTWVPLGDNGYRFEMN